MSLITEAQRPEALVNEAVVVTTQKQAVRKGGLPSDGPVANVVRLTEPAGAPREAASAIADLERTPERRGNRAGPAAEVQERTIRTTSDPDHAGIAADPL